VLAVLFGERRRQRPSAVEVEGPGSHQGQVLPDEHARFGACLVKRPRWDVSVGPEDVRVRLDGRLDVGDGVVAREHVESTECDGFAVDEQGVLVAVHVTEPGRRRFLVILEFCADRVPVLLAKTPRPPVPGIANVDRSPGSHSIARRDLHRESLHCPAAPEPLGTERERDPVVEPLGRIDGYRHADFGSVVRLPGREREVGDVGRWPDPDRHVPPDARHRHLVRDAIGRVDAAVAIGGRATNHPEVVRRLGFELESGRDEVRVVGAQPVAV